ncbi:uncharacterized protein LOC113510131 isoform X2 [Galleria mellonella]|uniref:Uncharacterized protein LOC113510131 isoform X2 n=1 Tax=Galleria mellonella TaxID=7137 RepID=A0ABM3MT81_GALME|nr:uncharacterized protein LOC113510131 isoform X2 [Galleria mellonella]
MIDLKMEVKTTSTSKIAASVLIIINGVTLICCSALFAFSLWMIASPSTLSNAVQSAGTPAIKTLLGPEALTVQVGVATAAVAGFVFCISLMGLYGAVSRSQFLLFMYSTLMLLLLLLECALFYYFSSTLTEKGLLEQDGQWTHALRLVFACCDSDVTVKAERKPPWSCCGPAGYPDNCTSSQLYEKDCRQTITAWLHRYQTAIYASLAVLHIILSSCSLVRRRRSASLSHR